MYNGKSIFNHTWTEKKSLVVASAKDLNKKKKG